MLYKLMRREAGQIQRLWHDMTSGSRYQCTIDKTCNPTPPYSQGLEF
jgi:hypothetical protein